MKSKYQRPLILTHLMTENRLLARRILKGDVVHRTRDATLSRGRFSRHRRPDLPGLWTSLRSARGTSTNSPLAPRQRPGKFRSNGSILAVFGIGPVTALIMNSVENTSSVQSAVAGLLRRNEYKQTIYEKTPNKECDLNKWETPERDSFKHILNTDPITTKIKAQVFLCGTEDGWVFPDSCSQATINRLNRENYCWNNNNELNKYQQYPQNPQSPPNIIKSNVFVWLIFYVHFFYLTFWSKLRNLQLHVVIKRARIDSLFVHRRSRVVTLYYAAFFMAGRNGRPRGLPVPVSWSVNPLLPSRLFDRGRWADTQITGVQL